MRTRFLIFISICLLFSGCKIYEGDYCICDEESFIAFSEAGYTEVTGDLTIAMDRFNLEGLEKLTKVGGLIIADNPNLETLKGLENLRKISKPNSSENSGLFPPMGTAMIYNNTSLRSLDGLDNLKSVDALTIRGNNALENIKANSITSVKFAIGIENNPVLENIEGFNGIISPLMVELYIKNNDSLIDIAGFNGLTSVLNLHISDHDVLENLSGFNWLRSTASLDISNNPELCTHIAHNLRDKTQKLIDNFYISGNKDCYEIE